MGFPKKLLNQGEDLILDLRPHWWFITPAAAGLVAAIGLGIAVVLVVDTNWVRVPVGILVLVALGNFIGRYTKWAGINFVVTSDRIIYRSGVIAKKGTEIPLERINTVFFEQSVFERLLGLGDLGIESAGEGGLQSFDNVRKPVFVQHEIYRAKELNEQRGYERIGEAASGARAAALSIPEQIDQLDGLRRRGAISEQEFETKKQELLNRM